MPCLPKLFFNVFTLSCKDLWVLKMYRANGTLFSVPYKLVLSPWKKVLCASTIPSCFSPLELFWQHRSFCHLYSCAICKISNNSNNKLYSFLRLTSKCIHNLSMFLWSVCSFLLLNHSQLYECIKGYLSIHVLKYIFIAFNFNGY
jgi:hypothetical protein